MNLNRLRPALIAALLLLGAPAWAVNCTPSSITLSSQDEVNNFQSNHGPGCDTVLESLIIQGASIIDLSPLAGLTAVSTVGPFGLNSNFQINNTSLTSLAGLENLSSVFWIELSNNDSLTSLAALSNLLTTRGPFIIRGNPSLTNLNGLQNLTSTGGALFLEYNPLLSDLSALANLETINASLALTGNNSLVDLDDFSGLTRVASNISISRNAVLKNIGGLGGLIDFDATLDLRYNNQLSSLGDLTNINRLGGLVIFSNPMLTNLDGLDNVTHMGNNTSLALLYNNTLSDISGLSSVISAEFDVEITNNPVLDDCSPLDTLLDAIDDGEPGPGPGDAGIPDVGGDVTLANNLPGCNSLPEPPEPVDGSFVYGGFGTDRQQLLFKGISITLGCFEPLLQIPNDGYVPDRRVQFACSAISYSDSDTLVFDVAANRCQQFADFQAESNLQIHAVYLENDNLGATLQEQAEAIFDQDNNALLQFDPQLGELIRGNSLLCALPKTIFTSGFE